MRMLTMILGLCLCAPIWSASRELNDDAGRQVAIPAEPKRIVVMHEPLLGIPLMDLGVNFVGAYGRRQDGRFVTAVDFIDSVFGPGRVKPQGFGALGQIDLERLRALKPDLIIGTELDIPRTARLSKLAPVYIQHVGQQYTYGFGVEEKLASVLGHENAFANRLALYRHKLTQVRQQLGVADAPSAPGQPTYLAILLTDQINVVGEMSGAIQALEDLGYRRLPLDDKGESNRLGSTLMVPISAERFGRLNPDLLVIMNNYTAAAGDDQEGPARATLQKILPGWERFMKPAREGRLLFLDARKVTTPSVQSALHTLDAVDSWTRHRQAPSFKPETP